MARDKNRLRASRAVTPPALSELTADLLEKPPGNGAIQAGDALKVGEFELRPTGLLVPDAVQREDWEALGLVLFRLERGVQWLIGDWLVYGVRRDWGQTEDIAQALGYSVQTLYNYAYCAGNVDFSLRRENLTFTHHMLVAAMEPEQQERWLAAADSNGWPVAEMRRQMGLVAKPRGADYPAKMRRVAALITRPPARLTPRRRQEYRAMVADLRELLDRVERMLE